MDYFLKFKELFTPNDQSIYLYNESESYSYGNLFDFSEQITLKIKSYQLNLNDSVGLFFNSKLTQIIATWGVVFSNHPFYSANLNTTKERLDQTFASTNLWIVDEKTYKTYFAENSEYSCQTIVLKKFITLYFVEKIKRLNLKLPNESFYLLQTSGTTGKPKVVIQSVESAFIFANWCIQELNISINSKFISISPLYFDMSIFDIFSSALMKSSLYVPSQSSFYFPADFINKIENFKINILYLTPGLISKLLKAKYKDLSHINFIILAGESFDEFLLKDIKIMFQYAQIYNFYGPTETNVCLFANITNSEVVNIGDACSYSKFILFDDKKNCIDQHHGEIYIAGPTVSIGYLEQEHSNNLKQIDHIFYYPTGDLAKKTNNGLIFLGRLDHQVKISGYRFSLLELETIALTFFPNTKVKAVNHKDDLYLIIFQAQVETNKTEFQKFLKKECQSYMIPKEIFYTNDESIGLSETLKNNYDELIGKLIHENKSN